MVSLQKINGQHTNEFANLPCKATTTYEDKINVSVVVDRFDVVVTGKAVYFPFLGSALGLHSKYPNWNIR